MLKAVIFDMDGVIVDSEPVHNKVEMQLFRELGISVTESERHAFIGKKTSEMWAELKERFSLKQPVEELVKMCAERFRKQITLVDGIHPIPGVIDLIKELHGEGLTLAVASSSFMEDINIVLGALDLDKYFALKVSGYQVKNGKPAPDIFLRTVELLGLKPEECVVIEDSENGVRAAKAAGIKCVGFRSQNSGNQDLSAADLIVESLQELNSGKLKELCL